MPDIRALPKRDELIHLNPTLISDFKSHVRVNGLRIDKCTVDDFRTNPCWIWHVKSGRKPAKTRYPRITVQLADGDRAISSNRLAIILEKGGIADSLYACHLCDTPLCVNPTHIVEESAQFNRKDALASMRIRNSSASDHTLIPPKPLWDGWDLPEYNRCSEEQF